MSIGRICSRTVVMAAATESVATVARRMDEENVGAIVVVGRDVRPIGIVTDRDVALRCAARALDAEATEVGAVMSEEVRTVDESTPIEEALRSMSKAAHRRLLVTGPEGALVGIVSVDDVVQLLAEEVALVSSLLRREGTPLHAPRGARAAG